MQNSVYEISIYDNKYGTVIYKKRLTIEEAIKLFGEGSIQLSKEEFPPKE